MRHLDYRVACSALAHVTVVPKGHAPQFGRYQYEGVHVRIFNRASVNVNYIGGGTRPAGPVFAGPLFSPDTYIHICSNLGCSVINCVLFIASRVSAGVEQHHLPQGQ